MKTKIFLLILILFLFSDTKVYAAVTVDFISGSSSPSQEGYSGPLTDESNCNAVIPRPPDICSNGPAVNQTTCSGESPCTGGDTWSKYSLSGCYRDDSRIDQYAWIFLYSTLVCSTGDKCIAGETNLRPGFCTCDYGPTPNKYCCTSTGSPEACIEAGTQDTSFPPEGQCPGGYIVDGSRVRSSACTPIVTPPPSPPAITCTVGQACTGTGSCAGTTTCPNGSAGDPVCVCPAPQGCTGAPQWSPAENVSATQLTTPTTRCTDGLTCPVTCSKTCTDSKNVSCPTACQSVWGCQGGGAQWYNSGKWYYSCPSLCDKCKDGDQQVICSSANVCPVP